MEGKTPKKYTREVLLRDRRFARYQPDFLRTVLNKPEYTLAEAEKAVRTFFGKERD